MKNLSSVNVRCSQAPHYFQPGYSVISLTTTTRPSAAIRYKNGARGSPYLNPLSDLNSVFGLQFTRTDNDEDCKHSFIQSIHFAHKGIISFFYNQLLGINFFSYFSKFLLKFRLSPTDSVQ